jgi:hypothetical protein
MAQANDLETTINKVVNPEKLSNFLDDNEPLKLALKLVLVIYAGLVAPKLGSYMKPVFDNTYFKILFFSILAYTANREPTISVLMAVAFVLSISYLKKEEQRKEGFDGSCSLRL